MKIRMLFQKKSIPYVSLNLQDLFLDQLLLGVWCMQSWNSHSIQEYSIPWLQSIAKISNLYLNILIWWIRVGLNLVPRPPLPYSNRAILVRFRYSHLCKNFVLNNSMWCYQVHYQVWNRRKYFPKMTINLLIPFACFIIPKENSWETAQESKSKNEVRPSRQMVYYFKIYGCGPHDTINGLGAVCILY